MLLIMPQLSTLKQPVKISGIKDSFILTFLSNRLQFSEMTHWFTYYVWHIKAMCSVMSVRRYRDVHPLMHFVGAVLVFAYTR